MAIVKDDLNHHIWPLYTINSLQDTTWGYALLIVGLMLEFMVIIYGANLFRVHIINAYGKNDIKVPTVWVYIVK